jgi:hypothetical protein
MNQADLATSEIGLFPASARLVESIKASLSNCSYGIRAVPYSRAGKGANDIGSVQDKKSVPGQKLTSRLERLISALPQTADLDSQAGHVRFVPTADVRGQSSCRDLSALAIFPVQPILILVS